RTVQRFAKEFGARAQVSLENRMACGVGACLGCVTKDGSGHHVQVCTRGPIFWADKVEL
ncbi:MAG TPA: dihydroorotate dehydrogenase electron transfer subunit, partial [Pseudodesulfovibrio sp.]|nr:dihydroorotate dehydrogenase electron transfer subunit [Pseudodesulfovibrio sp.]